MGWVLEAGYGFVYENNRVRNVQTGGPYIDTFSDKENIVRGNVYTNVQSGPQYLLGGDSKRNLIGVTRSGSTATAEMSSQHQYSVGNTVTIADFSDSAYNITTTITAIPSLYKFSYTVAGTPPTPLSGGTVRTIWRHHRVVIENNDITLIRTSDYTNAAWGVGITLKPNSDNPQAGEYLVKEAVIRGNRIRLMDGDMDPSLNKALAGIFVGDTERLICEDNIIQLPISIGPGFGVDFPLSNPKAHIYLWNVGQVHSRNNRRPEDNTLILPVISYGETPGFAITSITRSGTTATVTLASPSLLLYPGTYVTIFGVPPENPDYIFYNGLFRIATVISTTQFTYTMWGTPQADASGTLACRIHKFLGDMEYELALARQAPVSNGIIPAEFSAYVSDRFELSAGVTIEIGTEAILEIG
jgi:hypothetical protein